MSSLKMIAAICGITVFAVNALIAGNAHTAGPNPPHVENRKSVMLKRIDERIAHLQDERACFQAAMSTDDMKACREKFQMFRRQGGQSARRPNPLP